MPHGVMARALELVSIDEVAGLEEREGPVFTEGERAYARARSDPERRLAARLAAKRAAAALLGPGVPLLEIEVRKGAGGPPTLQLHGRARERLRELGASHALVSLTHGWHHAAASVLLLEGA